MLVNLSQPEFKAWMFGALTQLPLISIDTQGNHALICEGTKANPMMVLSEAQWTEIKSTDKQSCSAVS